MRDLTEEDEAMLPLPENWIRTIKIYGANSAPIKLYKNIKSGMETEEHPFILQALNSARKKTLPAGWAVKEVIFEDGTKDYSYFNAELGVSMWDPPLLRYCLSECLLANGYDPHFLFEDIAPQEDQQVFAHQEFSGFQDTDDNHNYFNDNSGYNGSTDQSYRDHYGEEVAQGFTGLHLDDLGDHYDAQADHLHAPEEEPALSVSQSTPHDQQDELSCAQSQQPMEPRSSTAKPRDWANLLNTYTDKNSVYTDKISHRIRRVRPPVTPSGVRVLRCDVVEANERIHQLLIKLRTELALQAGVQCSFLYHNANDNSVPNSPARLIQDRNVVTLASDIVTTLRQRPEHVVMAMATTNKTASPAMLQIAFTTLHRLLHPFSTDTSLTTAVLLQGINYQLDEMTLVEKIFSDRDAQRILSRALLVSDPVAAIKWNPLTEPLPVVPMVQSETVLTCLLRLYAIRRDVTSYFRTLWTPVVPAIIAVLNSDDCSGTHVFANLVAVANRILECTVTAKAMTVFPATATAICRAMHEIGGTNTMHAYLFNLLILPNLVKVLAGDHESAENEAVYRVDQIQAFVDKYFDHSLWLHPDEPVTGAAPQFNPLRSLIWAVWRLYSHAIHLQGAPLTTLTVQQFVQGRLPGMDLSGVPDTKLRTILERLHRKITRGCDYLLKMPLDVQGSEYLGLDPNLVELTSLVEESQQTGMGTARQQEMTKLLDKRMSTLHFKPNEMLNLTVVSRKEIGALFTDVGVAMELSDQAQGSSLYQAIAEYLNFCVDEEEEQRREREGVDDDATEELMELVFLYEAPNTKPAPGGSSESKSVTDLLSGGEDEESFGSALELTTRHKQLLRGLTLTNRYEDILIQMIHRAENRITNSLFDLVAAAAASSPYTSIDKSAASAAAQQYESIAPEFDTRFKSDHVRLATVHTTGSAKRMKQSHFGLSEPKEVAAYPLFSNHAPIDHDHPDAKSLASLNKEFFTSYRFGSTAPSVAVGTSLARDRVSRPKLRPDAVSVTIAKPEVHGGSKGRSKYTKVSIRPDSAILAPTASYKSVKSKEQQLESNLQEKDKKFMRAMRNYDVIPTEEFHENIRRRRQQGSRARRPDSIENSRDLSPSQRHGARRNVSRAAPTPVTAVTAVPNVAVPQPFPEHLRHRVRGDGQEEFWPSATETVPSRPRSDSPPRAKKNGSVRSKATRPAANNTSADMISKLISDYQQVFTPRSKNYQISDLQLASGSPAAAYSGGVDNNRTGSPAISRTLSRTSSGSRLLSKPAKSPSMPEPLQAETRFYAPTQSLLRKIDRSNSRERGARATNDSLDPRHLHDLELGAIAGLRSYKPTTDFAAPVFRPSGRRMHEPSGPRIPRVPEFLAGGHDDGRIVSRSSSPANRSRSSSPAGSRASSSYSNFARNSYGRTPQQTSEVDDDHLQPYDDGEHQYPLPTSPLNSSAEYGYDSHTAPQRGYQRADDSPQPAVDDREDFSVTYDDSSAKFVLNSRREAGRPVSLAAPAPREAPLSVVTKPLVSETQNRQSANRPELVSDSAVEVFTSTAIVAPKAQPVPSKPTAPPAAFIDVPISRQMLPVAKVSARGDPPGGTRADSPVLRQYSANTGSVNRGVAEKVLVVDPKKKPEPVNAAPSKSRPPLTKSMLGAVAGKLSVDIDIDLDASLSPQHPKDSRAHVAITPLSAYSIKFDKRDPQNVYDVNVDKEIGRNLQALYGSSSEEEDEDDQLRYLRNVPTERDGRHDSEYACSDDERPHSPKRPIPLFKKKSLIATREDSRAFLLKGFHALKHGRSGAPKQKFIMYRDDEQVIEWNASTSGSGLRRSSSIASFFSSSSGLPKVSSIAVGDILEVRRGIQTEVLKKASLVDPFCCFSIVTAERTLDLTMPTTLARDMAIRGLEVILEKANVRFI